MGTEQTPQNMQPPPEVFGEPPHPIPDLDALRAEYAKELSENAVDDEEDYEDDDEEDYEDDDEEDYEDEEDYDGHPAWYEPTQCSLCDKLFTPSNEEQCYCDDCEFRAEKD
jgi:hypothetical protein